MGYLLMPTMQGNTTIDHRSTSGGLLVLIGPNTYFPLQCQVPKIKSSFLQSLGIPPERGGEKKDSIPGGLPRHDIETSKESNGECWQFLRDCW